MNRHIPGRPSCEIRRANKQARRTTADLARRLKQRSRLESERSPVTHDTVTPRILDRIKKFFRGILHKNKSRA
jgi:hypothetical protein